ADASCAGAVSFPTTASATISGLSQNAYYYVRVCAKDNANNWSAPSSQIWVRTKNGAAPAAHLTSLDYGMCAKGNKSWVPYEDVTMCTLPGQLFEQDLPSAPGGWRITPF